MGSKHGLIYALMDPNSKQVNYVGATTRSLETRAHDHSRRQHSWKLRKWVSSLRSAGAEFHPIVLQDSIPKDELGDAEAFWIAFFKSCGAELLNISEGKGGLYIRSEATRKKLSDALIGRKAPLLSPEKQKLRSAKLSAALKGRKLPPLTPERKAQLRSYLESSRGKPRKYSARVIANSTARIIEAGKQEKTKQAVIKANAKQWFVMQPDGREVSVYNLTSYCRDHGLDMPTMMRVVRGTRGTVHHKGYRVRRASDPPFKEVKIRRTRGTPDVVAGMNIPPANRIVGSCDNCGISVDKMGKKMEHIFCSKQCWCEFFALKGGQYAANKRWGTPIPDQTARIAA